MLVKYLITRPSAALFVNHMFALSFCSCVVPVKVCYACEVFDNAAFGRVIFKSTFLLSWCSCVVIVNVCCAGCWLLAAGCWLLAAGCWLLAVGCWLGNLKESPLGSKGNLKEFPLEFQGNLKEFPLEYKGNLKESLWKLRGI